MKVIWKVDDGFIGNGEHTTDIPDGWLEGLEGDERSEEIESIVSNEFAEIVSFDILRTED